MKFKAVVFDLDGTLVDSLADLADSMNKVLKDNNFPCHEVNAYKYFVGDGIEILVRRALPEQARDEETVSRCTTAMTSEYDRSWGKKTCLYLGITQLLDELTAREVTMNILSNKPDNFTKLVVAEFLGKWQFAHVMGARADIPKKPSPQGALLIAQSLNIDPGEILYVGDTATDMETAVGAGMHGIGVLWGFRPEEELRASGAKAIITKPEEILQLL